MPQISLSEWETFLLNHPDSHILQTAPWGQLKKEFGWQIAHVVSGSAGAQLLFKQVFPGIRVAYIPKGPVGSDYHELWAEIDALSHQKNCVFLKIEPDDWLSDSENSQPINQSPPGFIQSTYSIQPPRTLLINISGDENTILSEMKQKTRYNINLARKKNVVTKPHMDLASFYHLMEITGQRDQFGIHSLPYYQRAYDLFHARDLCQLLVAEYESTPIAALIVFRNGNRAWYFYGASSDQHRDKMPNYLLQWEAIRWAKSQGCTEYDLWGVPDEELATLEANFTQKNKGLWGVYRFKRGFGGVLKRSSGPWDRVYKPFLYRIFQLILKYRKTEG